ncbi:CDP-glycerol--glycerophosphate glycerophosphotransferase [Bacillus sp. AFS076308]|uniref:CDP-glycerol glycerophosphotransferase family protein n=1 Tax=Bacillus sp. AFS076308 TaxID=2033512 RepID=UPI000BF2F805|nr:CDP-glycerol glycerophosphotransferase family protein [Bacillus sp. AFS076308]PFN80571.1 CDP-glycerol--glycerophosphate glycerophosphotransferase [Bacillus sp. AFS076308]
MVRELTIAGYLAVFKVVFTLLKMFPQQKKVSFVISFEENAIHLYRQLRKDNPSLEIVLLCASSVTEEFKKEINAPIIPFETRSIRDWVASLYHLATSKVVIIDNYYGFLSVVNFKKDVECIQIWHAAGALKTFGLKDHSITNRSQAAKRRFQQVYDQFDKIVVGSEEMAAIFSEAFNAPMQRMLRTGIPRTDFFYDQDTMQDIRASIYKKYPLLVGKKLILYAPTYRDGQLDNNEIHLDLKKMQQALQDEYVLLIKLHPAVKTINHYQEQYPNFVADFSAYKRVNELLLVADYLITDYSSLPFEYSLLTKPMIFFPYDLENYRKERGLVHNYETMVPGPVVQDTDQLIKVIEANQFDHQSIKEFSVRWNQYSKGNSSENLVQYIQSLVNNKY